MNPLVSIALCTFNGEKFLARQLDSLLSQDYRTIEIVAVDDCSTDNTWNILQAYAANDQRMHVYKNERNLGHTLNFEKAIKLCGGNFIALSDQDDVWEKHKITSLVGSINDYVMVYHNSDFIDDLDKRIGNETMASKNRMYDGESCLPIILANSVHGHTILFASELKKYIFPLDEKFSHDWAIVFAAFNIGKVKYIDQVLVHYRQHQGSITDYLEKKDSPVVKKSKGLGRLQITEGWLTYCLNFGYKREADLVNQACALFLNLLKEKNKLRCFLFMLQHFDLLFYTIGYKRRGVFSKINFVRKLCFVK